MAIHELLPVESWLGPEFAGMRHLRDPISGATYTPHEPPEIIRRDPELMSGIEYMQAKAGGLTLHMTFGMQKQSEDLGDPANVSALVHEPHVLFDTSDPDIWPTAYSDRLTAEINAAGAARLLSAHSSEWPCKRITTETLWRLKEQQLGLLSIAAMHAVEDRAGPLMVERAAAAHVANANNWGLFATVGTLLASDYELSQVYPVRSGVGYRVALSLKPGELGVERVAQYLGYRHVSINHIGKERWGTDGVLGRAIEDVLVDGVVDRKKM